VSTRVVVLGTGFAGLTVARALARALDWTLSLPFPPDIASFGTSS